MHREQKSAPDDEFMKAARRAGSGGAVAGAAAWARDGELPRPIRPYLRTSPRRQTPTLPSQRRVRARACKDRPWAHTTSTCRNARMSSSMSLSWHKRRFGACSKANLTGAGRLAQAWARMVLRGALAWAQELGMQAANHTCSCSSQMSAAEPVDEPTAEPSRRLNRPTTGTSPQAREGAAAVAHMKCATVAHRRDVALRVDTGIKISISERAGQGRHVVRVHQGPMASSLAPCGSMPSVCDDCFSASSF